VDEAGRSAKPPLMTASAADDVISDAEEKASASKPDVKNRSPEASSGSAAKVASASTAVDDDVSDVPSSDDADDYPVAASGTADDDADAFSWDTSTWSSPSWESGSSSSDSAPDAPAPAEPESSSVFSRSASAASSTSSASPASSASASGASTPLPASSLSSSSSSAGDGARPYPADEIGKPRPDAGARPDYATTPGNTPTRAQPVIPDGLAAANGTGQPPSASVFETATSALSSTLDRGRQAWRQALTGPNNWLSSRSSSPTSTPPSATTPSGYTGSGAGYSGAGSYASAPAEEATGSGDARYGSTGYSGYSGTTGYSAPASGGASYGGPAAASAAVGAGVASGSPWGGAGSATETSAGAAYSGATRTSVATGTPTTEAPPAWQPRTTVTASKSKRKNSRRQAQLTLSRVEPWSVMKFSFLVSVVAFIVLFVAVAVLYMALSSLGVFDSLQHTVNTLTSAKNQAGTNVSSWFSASRILGYTGMLGALNIVLITAISTIGAVIYNLIAQTIGGIEVTLRESD
jgi:hypothetical protein